MVHQLELTAWPLDDSKCKRIYEKKPRESGVPRIEQGFGYTAECLLHMISRICNPSNLEAGVGAVLAPG